MSHEKVYLQHIGRNSYKLHCDEDRNIKRIVVPHNQSVYKALLADTFEATINGVFLVEDVYSSLDASTRILWEIRGLKEKTVPAHVIVLIFEEPLEQGKRFIYAN